MDIKYLKEVIKIKKNEQQIINFTSEISYKLHKTDTKELNKIN